MVTLNRIAIVFTLAFVIGLCSVITAKAQGWSVERVAGTVWSSTGPAEARTLAPGSMVPPGALITASKNGRVILARGPQRMLVSPNSVVTVPSDAARTGGSTVNQYIGKVTFDVDRRAAPHFSVETPYLAAVVKGTRFAVSVTRVESRVAVERGGVEVSDHRTGQRATIGRGQKAAAGRGRGGLAVGGSGPPPRIEQGAPREPVVDSLQLGGGRLVAHAPTYGRRIGFGRPDAPPGIGPGPAMPGRLQNGLPPGRAAMLPGPAVGQFGLNRNRVPGAADAPAGARAALNGNGVAETKGAGAGGSEKGGNQSSSSGGGNGGSDKGSNGDGGGGSSGGGNGSDKDNGSDKGKGKGKGRN